MNGNESLGGLNERDTTPVGIEEEQGAAVASLDEYKKKRKPFYFWDVAGKTHKLKLQTAMISKLENKYRRNLLNIVSDDGIPPLSVMLTIIQAALTPWEHGTTYSDVEKLYDLWVENDKGSQTDLLTKVVIPTMAVSGFFTPEQTESIMTELETATDLI
jgi:hypothetical protein